MLTALSWLALAPGPEAQPAGGLTFESALSRAAAASPRIVAARARLPVARAGRAIAAERPNPELRLEIERETPTRAYGVAVPLELGGKRPARMSVVEAAVRTGEAELEATLADLRADVRRAYFACAVDEARLALLGELRDLGSRGRAAAQARFEAGSAPRLELVQAELALAQVDNDVTAARAASRAARTTLNALLGNPLDDAAPLESALDTGPIPDPDEAVRQALAGNGELSVLQRRVEEQAARVALARAMRTPDVIAEATLTRDAAPEFDTGWRVALTATLPLFTTHAAGVRLEEVTLASARAELDAARTRVTAGVAATATLARAQYEQYTRYRDQILPQARDVERMAEDAYALGQSGITGFLQAVQVARETRLRALQAAADFQDTLADLDRAIGAVRR